MRFSSLQLNIYTAYLSQLISSQFLSFDKLLGGTELEIEEVYAYKEGAYVTENYRDGGCWKDR